jgi:hypothetical protein
MPRYSIAPPIAKSKSPVTNPAAVVNIARSQKVERAETNDAGMTVRSYRPNENPLDGDTERALARELNKSRE